MANAIVDKVWRDKSSKDKKNYFALAVLKRQTAELILQGARQRAGRAAGGAGLAAAGHG